MNTVTNARKGGPTKDRIADLHVERVGAREHVGDQGILRTVRAIAERKVQARGGSDVLLVIVHPPPRPNRSREELDVLRGRSYALRQVAPVDERDLAAEPSELNRLVGFDAHAS